VDLASRRSSLRVLQASVKFPENFLKHVELAASYPLYVQTPVKLQIIPKGEADAICPASLHTRDLARAEDTLSEA